MSVLSTLWHLFYNNYNITPLLYKVYPEAYLKIWGIKNLTLGAFSFLQVFFLPYLKNHATVLIIK